MMTALACDLQSDFYPYFEKLLPVLVDLTAVKDVEIIERAFTCIAHLFKELKSMVMPHMKKIFKTFSPCLRNKKVYVVVVAAQVMAYLAKHSSFKHFIEIANKTAMKEDGLDYGVGLVLFESLLDDDGLALDHEELLKVILESYVACPEFSDDSMKYFVEAMSSHAVLVERVWTFLKESVSSTTELQTEVCHKISSLMKTMVLQEKATKNHAVLVCDFLVKAYQLPSFPINDVIEMAMTLLVEHYQQIPISSINRLIQGIIGNPDPVVKHAFTVKMSDYKMFGRDVVPVYLREVDPIISNWRPTDGDQQLRPALSTISSIVKTIEKKIKISPEMMTALGLVLDHLNDSKMTWMTLKILSQTEDLKTEVVKTHVKSKTDSAIERIISDPNPSLLDLSIVELAIMICYQTDPSLVILSKITEMVLKHPSNLFNTNIVLDVLPILTNDLSSIVQSLTRNLSSPFKTHRMATLKFLSSVASSKNNVLSMERKHIDLCLCVEDIDVTPHNFREKQQLLTQLAQIVSSEEASDAFRVTGMHFLLGCLYVNFTPLWKTIQQLLVQCIHSDNKRLGLKEIVIDRVHNVFNLLSETDRPDFDDQQMLLQQLFDDVKLPALNRERPDHVTYLVNVLQVMESTSEAFEPVNRSYVPLFLDLAKEALNLELERPEFDETVDDEEEASEQKGITKDNVVEVDEETPSEEDELPDGMSVDTQDKWRLIIAFLKLFSKFKNPKNTVRSAEMESLYYEFLKSPRGAVAEHAFQCICSFNPKHVIPYKEQMLPFFKEQGFKFAMRDFVITGTNEDDRVLKDKDREHVMPILMRILSGRMKVKTANKRLKSASQNKKALIMRYIAGCSASEVSFFMRLNFSFIESFLRMEYQELVNSNLSWPDIEIFKMECSLKTLVSMMKSLGNLVSDGVLQQFLKILLVISSFTKTKKEGKEELNTRMKTLRSQCIKHLITFFSNFEHYPYNEEEINAIFLLLVTPSMKTFLNDNLGNVSQILLLFKTWSENSRFFPLINLSMNSVKPLPMILSVLDSGKAVKAVENVVLDIIHNLLTLNDLSSEAMETDSVLPKSIQLTGCISFDGKVILQPFLSMIIAFYAKHLRLISKKSKTQKDMQSRDLKVLQSLSEVVEDPSDCLCLGQLLIDVFSRHYIADHESTEEFSQTILKMVSQTGSQGTKLIGSIAPLFARVQEPSVRMDLAKSVETIVQHGVLRQESQNEKKSANETTTSQEEGDPVEENEKKLENVVLMLSESVRLLHECSSKRIDEPDFDSRFQGFDKITQALKCVSKKLEEETRTGGKKRKSEKQGEDKAREEGAVKSGSAAQTSEYLLKMTLDLFKITAYSCCFFLTQSSLDQSLKTCSCTLLEKMAVEFAHDKKTKFFNELLINIVLKKGIRSGFKDTHEKTRLEFIGVLRSLMLHCRDRHTELKEMSRLMHRDNEVDFWQNVRHLQVHRRAKAFSRLASHPKLLQRLSQEVLWHYILPLAEQIIRQEDPRAPDSLIVASIELIGSVSRLLDYRPYEQLLRKYLSLMSKGNPSLTTILVKVISKILSNFNYDLSNASEEVLLSQRHESSLAASRHESQADDKTGHESPDKTDGEDALNLNEGEDVLMQSQEDEEGVTTTLSSKEVAITSQDDMMSGDEEEGAGESDQTETQNDSGNMRKLSAQKATFVLGCIVNNLLPQLKKTAFEIAFSDFDSDAKMSKTYDESDQVQKIPIMIAVVKLLVVIPSRFKILEDNLSGILLRLCHFLKSRTDSIRQVARKSLKMVVSDLGPSFLPDVFKELKNTLTRGFQRHILSFTVHYLLVSMKDVIVAGSLDDTFPLLLDIVFEDLFGQTGQEKENDKFKSKTKETSKTKAYEILHIMSCVSGETAVIPLFVQLKSRMSECRSFKNVKKVTKCLDFVILGLSVNGSLSVKTLCTLIYGISQEQIEELKKQEEEDGKDTIKKRSLYSRLRKESCLLIQDANKKMKKRSKVSSVNHMLVLTEKALVLLHQLLKNRRLKNSDREHLSLLDPIVVILKDSLSSKHVKLVCAAMRCLLNLFMEFPGLPSLRTHCNDIKNHLFVLLSQNSKYSGMDGEHRTLIALSFRLISFLVGSFSRVEVTSDQVIILLTHIDEDLTLGGTKPTSFILLAALLERKILNPKIDELMRTVFKLAIQSESDTVRARSVRAILSYLKQCEKSDKPIRNHLLFFIKNLEYETEPGRLSAIRVISKAIKGFAVSFLESNLNLLLIPFGCRLINEDSLVCKESIYKALKYLILSVNQEKRDKMFQQLILAWFQDQDFMKNILAMHVMSILIEGEPDFLEKRGPAILPVLLKSLRETAPSDSQEFIQEEKDRLLFQQLTLFRQILMTSGEVLVRRPAPQELPEKKKVWRTKSTPLDILRQEVNETWNVLQDFYLMYPHSWVRLITAQIFGHLFSLYDPQALATASWQVSSTSLSEVAASSQTHHDEYLLRESREETFLFTLTKKFVSLFRGISDLQDPLAEQLVQNLGFVAKLVIFRDRLRKEEPKQVNNNCVNETQKETLHKTKNTKKSRLEERVSDEKAEKVLKEMDDANKQPFTLKDFVYEILRAIKLELTLNQSSVCIRIHILKLVAVVVVELQKEELESVLDQLLRPLGREVTDPKNAMPTTETENNSGSNNCLESKERESLVLLSQQVLDIIKSLVGDDVFNHSYARTQLETKKRRLQRKQEKALDVSKREEETSSHQRFLVRRLFSLTIFSILFSLLVSPVMQTRKLIMSYSLLFRRQLILT